MDPTNWKTGLLKVTALELDQLNPRIPGVATERTTRDIVAALIEHEDIHSLAKSIVDFGGLYPSERLIAVDENGEKIVLEGNRRLASLKLLHSPDLAPEQHVERFRNLSNRIDPHQIEKVEVVLAPSRAAAARLIVARHTGDVVRRWSPAQQARYIRTLVKPGYTIEDVAEDIKLPPGDIRDFLRTDTMLQLAHLMPLQGADRASLDNQKFSVTTLERLIQSKEGQKFLGLSFDSDGNAVGSYSPDEFKKAYTRIVTDIARGDIDTRKLNTNSQISDYLNSLGKSKPNRARKGTWTSTSLMSGKTKATSAALKIAIKPKSSSRSSRDEAYLIPKGFRCGLKQPRIKEIFGELRRLKRHDYPNCCAVLTRIFVELAVGYHLDKTGKIQPLLDKAKKDKKPADWYPTLGQMMALLLKDPAIGLKPLARKALNRMLSDDESLLSLEHINQFVHDRYTAPTDRDLKMMWAKLEPLLEVLMEEPVVPTPKPAST